MSRYWIECCLGNSCRLRVAALTSIVPTRVVHETNLSTGILNMHRIAQYIVIVALVGCSSATSVWMGEPDSAPTFDGGRTPPMLSSESCDDGFDDDFDGRIDEGVRARREKGSRVSLVNAHNAMWERVQMAFKSVPWRMGSSGATGAIHRVKTASVRRRTSAMVGMTIAMEPSTRVAPASWEPWWSATPNS
jgi:hypothetical protein